MQRLEGWPDVLRGWPGLEGETTFFSSEKKICMAHLNLLPPGVFGLAVARIGASCTFWTTNAPEAALDVSWPSAPIPVK